MNTNPYVILLRLNAFCVRICQFSPRSEPSSRIGRLWTNSDLDAPRRRVNVALCFAPPARVDTLERRPDPRGRELGLCACGLVVWEERLANRLKLPGASLPPFGPSALIHTDTMPCIHQCHVRFDTDDARIELRTKPTLVRVCALRLLRSFRVGDGSEGNRLAVFDRMLRDVGREPSTREAHIGEVQARASDFLAAPR